MHMRSPLIFSLIAHTGPLLEDMDAPRLDDIKFSLRNTDAKTEL